VRNTKWIIKEFELGFDFFDFIDDNATEKDPGKFLKGS